MSYKLTCYIILDVDMVICKMLVNKLRVIIMLRRINSIQLHVSTTEIVINILEAQQDVKLSVQGKYNGEVINNEIIIHVHIFARKSSWDMEKAIW